MNNVEDIYSLSPSQQGLLSHGAYEPESRVYYQQLSLGIQGELNIEAFKNSWQGIMQRHSVMRTAFLWEDLDDAYQVVQGDIPLPLELLDWRTHSDVSGLLATLEEQQKTSAFDFAGAPLMRIALVQLADQQWHFIWTFHHILMDGWSVGIAMQEWFSLYLSDPLVTAEAVTGKSTNLALSRSYKEYISWLGLQDEQRTQAFWREQLGHVTQLSALPDFDVKTACEYALPFAEQELHLSIEQTSTLDTFARAQHLTLNSVIQGAWALLLGMHSDRKDVLYGVTVAGRPDDMAGAEDMVGLFINTLPLHLNWEDNPVLSQWLQNLQQLNSEMRQHAYLPVSKLRPLSKLPANGPMFESILVFENFPVAQALNEGAENALRFVAPQSEENTGDVRLTHGRNHFPLSLMVVPGENLEFIFSYQRERFSDLEIKHLLVQLQQLLQVFTYSADAQLSSVCGALASTDKRGREQLLDWGRGASQQPPQQCVQQIFEQVAQQHPQRIAVSYHQQHLSYSEINNRANQLSHMLIAKGVTPDSVVALVIARQPDFVVALLAVLKAGAAYLPFDIKQPAQRLHEVLECSEACYVLHDSAWQRKGNVTEQVPHLCLSTELDDISEYELTTPQVAHSDKRSAYVIFTSGSTGTPKGVQVSHSAIVSYVHSAEQALKLEPNFKYALLSTVAADLGHSALFAALCLGGSLVLVDEDTSFNPLQLADYLHAHQVDVLKITPSHLSGLLAAHSHAHLLPRQRLIFGGDTLTQQLLAQVFALNPQLSVYNHYGPSESTVGAVAGRVTVEQVSQNIIPLGKPLAQRELYVLDAHQQLVAVGVPGELYIGSGLADGYLHRRDLTVQAFVNIAHISDARLYRTGDKVVWLASGELAFLGRLDNQVKIRGNRIELGEVEAQIYALSPLISHCVVRLHTPEQQQARLLAYIVTEQSLSVTKLTNDLASKVPDYMVPAHFVMLDEIPLNANGKADFQQLPIPDATQRQANEYIEPRNATERVMVQIWKDVLKIDQVGIDDNFFTLGGDSILNLQIIARANQQGLKLTPKQLFENSTIAGIAQVISGDNLQLESSADSNVVELPLSSAQRAIIESTALYPSWRCMTLDAKVSGVILADAMQAVCRHHQALQLHFTQNNSGTWSQHLKSDYQLPCINTTALATDDIAGLAADIGLQLVDSGKSFVAHIIETAEPEGQAQLLLVAHPLSIDEGAWQIVLQDVQLALSQLSYERPLRLSPVTKTYAMWLAHQCQYGANDSTEDSAGNSIEESWEHWLQYVGGDFSELPAALLSASKQQTAESETTERLAIEPSKQLKNLLNSLQIDEKVLLASIVSQLQAQLSDDNAPMLLALNCGRADSKRMHSATALAKSHIQPEGIVGSMDVDTPVILQGNRDISALEHLIEIDSQYHSHPQQGSDYAVLRYLCDNEYMIEPLLSLPNAQIRVRYLGDWSAHQEENGIVGAVVSASDNSCQHADNSVFILEAYWQQGQLCLRSAGAANSVLLVRIVSALQELATLSKTEQLQPARQAFVLCADQAQTLATLQLDWQNIADVYPLSPMQQGMLLHTLLQPGSGIYLMQQRYSWDGVLNKAALEFAWQLLLERHPTMRSGFWWQDDLEPVQCVYRNIDCTVQWFDLRDLSKQDQQQEIDKQLAQELKRGFDMDRGPLTRLRVFQLADQKFSLVRSFHHILTDAWCFGLLMEDLLAIYQAKAQQQPVARPLFPEFRQYMSWLGQQSLTGAEQFWRENLKGFEEPIVLPIDTPGILSQQSPEDISEVDFTLSIAQTSALQRLCQEHQLTPNTWVQGAWSLLLSRYSNNDDVLFGVTVAGRPPELAGSDQMVGIFINSLPLRVKVNAEQDCISWLQQLLADNAEMRQFEFAPLVQVQRWSDVPRDSNLFNSLVVFENAPLEVDQIELDEFSIDIYEDRVHTNFPITVVLYPGDRLGVRLSYDKQLFTHQTMQRMLQHLVELLTNMLEQPQAPLQQLQMLQEKERQQILTQWNQTQQDFPLDKSYAQLFAEQLAIRPEQSVAVCDGQSLSYAQLDANSEALAIQLRKAGARTDSIVALMAERGLTLLTMMLATLKAGAAFQSVDVNHPAQRIGELLNLSAAPIVLASQASQQLLDDIYPQLQARPQCLVAQTIISTAHIGEAGSVISEVAGNTAASSATDLAYVVFTSGSTGKPKGVMIESQGMLNNIFGKVPSLGLSAEDKIAQTASPAFDISIWQFLAAPILGATVHILRDEIAQDPARLLQAIETHSLSILEAVPAVIQGMIHEAQNQLEYQLESVRWVLPTGDALPTALVKQWFERFANVPLMNAYGPAECSDDVAFYAIADASAAKCSNIPIGRPTANNQLYIVDSALHPVPVGVAGEICVAGVGVGRGYLHAPELTAAVFVDHPFADKGRFYRTGDIGRYLADGQIEYIGRSDQQVKIRGHRIELGEVENRIAQLTGVSHCALVAAADPRGALQLVVFYVVEKSLPYASALATKFSLKTQLQSQLAAYMVPEHWVVLQALPLTANGKVDRKQLTAQAAVQSIESVETIIAARTDTEQSLLEIWQQVLKVEQISIDDNFFSLGGHSLLATQVMSRVRRQFKVELPLKTLFESSVLMDLASTIEQAQQCTNTHVEKDIPLAPRDQPLPLSYAQQRLWFVDQLEGANAAYNITTAVNISGQLNIAALEAVSNYLLQRHESLRTRFVLLGEQPSQIIEDFRAITVKHTDISHLASDTADQQTQLQQVIDAEAAISFDLSKAPMLRVALVKLDKNNHVLQLTIHHIATDAWSMQILVEEFVAAYLAVVQGKVPELAKLNIQYADFAYWQRSEAQQTRLAVSIDYWRKALQGAPTYIKLPRDHQLPAVADYTGRSITHSINPAQLSHLKALTQQHNSTLYMLLLNSFNCLLQRSTGENDFIVGTDLANRTHTQLEHLIGFFVNVLPLRAQLGNDTNFIQRLQHLRENTLEAFEHQEVPFDKLVELLQPPRQVGVSPLVQVLFVMQNTPQSKVELEGLTFEDLSSQYETSKFDLALFVEEDEQQQLTVRWLYRENLFNSQTIAQLQQGFESLLNAVVDNAEQCLDNWQWSAAKRAAYDAVGERKSMHSEVAHYEAIGHKGNDQKKKVSRKKSKLNKLKKVKAVAVSQAANEQVKTSLVSNSTQGNALPLVIEPKLAELDPSSWALEGRAWIDSQLRSHGGLLFRGFNLADAQAFEAFAKALEPSLYGQYGDLPKNVSGKNLYHSTPYPEKQMILYHNESSHMASWPRKQWFFCETPSPIGGCTPIVDCRKVYQCLSEQVRKQMETLGLLYVRHFTEKLDVRWEDFFKTQSRLEVEEKCRLSGMRCEWYGDNSLRVEQPCEAVVIHPDTGEKTFFNQVQLHHEYCLEPEVRSNLHSLFGADQLPRNVYYGDGSVISDEVMSEIGRVYEACAVRFDWQKGDVVMLDNMLVAHARDPFEGPRKICVAMGQMMTRDELAVSTQSNFALNDVTQ
jgi:amino acid adenylation domain-containing protein